MQSPAFESGAPESPTLAAESAADLSVAVTLLRLVSWNVRFAGIPQAAAQAKFLRSLNPHIVLLQEVNASSIATYRAASELDWLTCSRSAPLSSIERKRQPAAAIGGKSVELLEALPELAAAPLPERIHRSVVRFGDHRMVVASYYAPPGVTFGYKKVENALAFLRWIQRVAEPMIVGADANSPKVDHPDFSLTKSWWHTGSLKLRGRPGDDSLWGPQVEHRLKDALRSWLDDHPDELARIVDQRPNGPLAISHWTGRRLLDPDAGVARRYDSIWASADFSVQGIEYLGDSIGVLSDHAAVMASLELEPRRS